MYVIIAMDEPDSEALRLETRAAHLAYLKATPILAAAGPFADEHGTMVGSMVLLNTDERAMAEAFAANDPYAKAGLFATVDIRPWRHAIGALPAA